MYLYMHMYMYISAARPAWLAPTTHPSPCWASDSPRICPPQPLKTLRTNLFQLFRQSLLQHWGWKGRN